MNEGLRFLLRTQPRAFLRGIGRRIGGSRPHVGSLVALLLGAGLLALMAFGQAFAWIEAQRRSAEEIAADLALTRAVGPVAITTMLLLLDLSGKGLFFRPAEAAFLFPAPLTRREVLVYHLVSRGGLQLLSGLWMSLFTVRFAGTFTGGVVATVLAMLFVHVAASVWSLLVAGIGDRWGAKARIAVWLAVGAALAFGARTAFLAGAADGTVTERVLAAANAPAVRIATLPARPFAEAFAAETFLGALPWLAVSLVVVAAGAFLVIRLDGAFTDAAAASSERLAARLRSMRSGEGAFVASASAVRRRVPPFPALGGAGPLAWRQLTELVRNPASVLWSAGGMLFCVLLILGLPEIGPADDGGRVRGFIAIALVLALSTFMNQGFPYDFRRDLDRMPVLAGLPLPPLAVAAGQLIVPALVFTVEQWIFLGIVAARTAVPAEVVLAVALLAPAWNWYSASLDNALFLVLPYRIDPEDPANMPFLGRLTATMAAKSFGMALVGVPAALLVAAGLALGGIGGVFVGAGALVLLVVAAVVGTWAVGRAFRACDASRDV